MSGTITLPSTLRPDAPECIIVADAETLDDVIEALDARFPGLGSELVRVDSGFNFAVNDEMLMGHLRECRLKDGDRVEIVPAMSGG
jgi:molybdopterin converting factor small subunit